MNTRNINSGLTPLYVIGFPKSGNTWLARLLADVSNSNIAVANDRDVINAADNSAKRGGRFIVHKVHVIKDRNEASKGKLVYIVRDVRDVLISAFFFSNRFIDEEGVLLRSESNNLVRFLKRSYFEHQIRRVNKRWCGNQYQELKNYFNDKAGIWNWSEHVEYWEKQQDVTFVKYEDLLIKTFSELKRICVELEIETDDLKLQEAVARQSFGSRKRLFESKSDDSNAKFLRKGLAGDWKRFMNESLLQDIYAEHGHVLHRLGYF